MKKLTPKIIIIFIIVTIILVGVGFIGGFYTKILIDEAQIIKEKEKQTSLAALMSDREINQLKEKIEKDEEDYGEIIKNSKHLILMYIKKNQIEFILNLQK